MMNGILSFSQIQSLLFRSFLAKLDTSSCPHILERLNWLVQYQEKRILFYWIPIHVGIRGNEKADAAAKAGFLRSRKCSHALW